MNPRLLAALLGASLIVVVVLGVLAALRPVMPSAPRPPEPAAEAGVEPPPAVAAARILRAWDARRGRAWARGDLAGLRRLYLPGSRSGGHDRRALAAYVDRGLRVTGLRMQLLAVVVEHQEAGEVVLRVSDRMRPAVARGRGGVVRLPRDAPSSWRVSLRRLGGTWRVAEVRRAPPPARP